MNQSCIHPWHTLPLMWRAPSCPLCRESHPSGCWTLCRICLHQGKERLVPILSFAVKLRCENGHTFLRSEI
jgi:hypothetical protein